MPYTIDQFSSEIKVKHPQYKDWDNNYLAAEVMNKHGAQYKGWVSQKDYVALHKVSLQNQRQQLTKNKTFVPETEGYQDTGGVTGFLKSRANQLNESMTRGEQGKQTAGETGFQMFGNTVLSPVVDVVGKVLSPIDKLRQVVLNQGAGRFANIISGKGNKPVEEPNPLQYASPRTAANLEGGLNLLSAGMMVAGGGTAKNKAKTELKAAQERVAVRSGEKATLKTDTTTGQIVQGETADIAAAKNVLSDVDVSKVKTYSDLEAQLAMKEKRLVEAKGKALESKKGNTKLKELEVDVAGTKHNFVKDALDQLDNYYTKTNNVKAQSEMKALRAKAETEGLTIKELDDLAVRHGKDLNAYNANGELASGLNKQAAENTRMGLKNTAREQFGNEAYKAADSQLSDTIRTRKLVNDMVEQVNKLKQKVTSRSLGEKAGRLVGRAVNLISGGTAKGFVESFFPRSQGIKVLNALDLEAILQKNLRLLQKAAAPGTSEATIINNLQQLVDELGSQLSPLRNVKLNPKK